MAKKLADASSDGFRLDEPDETFAGPGDQLLHTYTQNFLDPDTEERVGGCLRFEGD